MASGPQPQPVDPTSEKRNVTVPEGFASARRHRQPSGARMAIPERKVDTGHERDADSDSASGGHQRRPQVGLRAALPAYLQYVSALPALWGTRHGGRIIRPATTHRNRSGAGRRRGVTGGAAGQADANSASWSPPVRHSPT